MGRCGLDLAGENLVKTLPGPRENPLESLKPLPGPRENPAGFHQASPGFHQVFTRFSPACFSPSFHQVFTRVFTRFSPGFSPGFHQVFTRFSHWFSHGFSHWFFRWVSTLVFISVFQGPSAMFSHSLSCRLSPGWSVMSRQPFTESRRPSLLS